MKIYGQFGRQGDLIQILNPDTVGMILKKWKKIILLRQNDTNVTYIGRGYRIVGRRPFVFCTEIGLMKLFDLEKVLIGYYLYLFAQ